MKRWFKEKERGDFSSINFPRNNTSGYLKLPKGVNKLTREGKREREGEKWIFSWRINFADNSNLSGLRKRVTGQWLGRRESGAKHPRAFPRRAKDGISRWRDALQNYAKRRLSRLISWREREGEVSPLPAFLHYLNLTSKSAPRLIPLPRDISSYQKSENSFYYPIVYFERTVPFN